MGRPTKYRPAFCEQAIELGRLGKSVTQIAYSLGITKETVYQWVKIYPEFSDAIAHAKTHSQAWWEILGQEALDSPCFQAGVYNKQMANRFRNAYDEDARFFLSHKKPNTNAEEIAQRAMSQALKLFKSTTADEVNAYPVTKVT
jgi:hypothetical protein